MKIKAFVARQVSRVLRQHTLYYYRPISKPSMSLLLEFEFYLLEEVVQVSDQLFAFHALSLDDEILNKLLIRSHPFSHLIDRSLRILLKKYVTYYVLKLECIFYRFQKF